MSPMPDQPPPLPNPIKRMLFQDSVMFTTDSSVNFGLVEKVQAAAEAWINGNPQNNIVHIETLSNAGKARCIIWYRER
jgi:hypothetical protein